MDSKNNAQTDSDINELAPELLSIHAFNPFVMNNSPPRGNMFAGHFAQRLIIKGSEPNLIQTGMEEEMGKYTLSTKMPADGTILRVLPLYPRSIASGEEAIDFNPETLVLYRNDDTGEYDCFTLPYYCSLHPTFGFKYEDKPALDALWKGTRSFAKDTVFQDSPAVKGDHHYTYGKNLNVIYMSHPNVGLDGFVINENILDDFEFTLRETRHVQFGASEVPLNLYGDDHRYKGFPEIGDYVREDGLLMALRRYDPVLAPAMMSRRDMREVNYLFDNKIYARQGQERGRVIHLTVTKSDNVNRQMPDEMTMQLDKYARALHRFHRDIVTFEEQMIAENRKLGGDGKIQVSKQLQRLLVKSKAVINYRMTTRQYTPTGQPISNKQNLTLVYRKEPLDAWRLTFTIEYKVRINKGFKLTCGNGGKGVVCRTEKPENMPVDEDGNVSDIISGPDSIPGRMNLGRLYAPYFNGAARDVRKQMLEEFGLDRQYKGPISLEELRAIPRDRYAQGLNTILKFYHIVTQRQYEEFVNTLTADEQELWVQWLINDKPYLYIPVDSQKAFDQMVLEIEANFKLVYGPVTYVGRSGRRVTTKNKFRIAPLYMMLLDKIADTWLSADIGKHNNFGILAAMNQVDKFSTPWRRTSPRVLGETEARLYCMYGGREMIAELMDRSGNIVTQQEIANQIIHHPTPGNIDNLVDRNKVPLGGARPIQIAQHQFRCAGFSVVHGDEK